MEINFFTYKLNSLNFFFFEISSAAVFQLIRSYFNNQKLYYLLYFSSDLICLS